jgi:hypothetical protein
MSNKVKKLMIRFNEALRLLRRVDGLCDAE